MSYRAAFWMTAIVGVIAGFLIPYFLWQSIFESQRVERIGGFTFDAMVLYYVVVVLLGKVVRGKDMGLGISREIYEGTLTRYLIYPTQVVVFKYAQQLGEMLPQLLQLALFAGFFGLVLNLPEDLHITPMSVALAAVSVMLANLIYYFLSLAVMGVAFWADNVWSLAVLLRFVSAFFGGAMVPIDLFPQQFQQALAGLPFMYFFYFPVQTLLGHVTFTEWLTGTGICLAWGVVFAGVAHWVWKRGELRYTGVGI